MKSFNLFREQSYAKAFLVLAEKEMTASQMKKREEIAQSMNDEDFKKRYGKDWMSVKMATATKQAMKEEEEFEEEYIDHMCAKHVYHDVFGEGVVVEGEHDTPDEDGFISWYTVEFPHGKETVYTEDVMVMHERYHGHMMKKKKMKEEVNQDEDQLDEISKKTMMNYADKAFTQRKKAKTGYQMELMRAKADGDEPNEKYLDMKKKVFDKRTKGIQAVQQRLREERDAAQGTKTEAKLHPNQQQLDVHEPEKDELTAKDFEMLRKIKKARNK